VLFEGWQSLCVESGGFAFCWVRCGVPRLCLCGCMELVLMCGMVRFYGRVGWLV